MRVGFSLAPLQTALAKYEAVREFNEAAWVLAVAKGVETARKREAARPRRDSGVATGVSTSHDSIMLCGGDLPPCYVAQRESGGSYSAYNPTGCGGSGCYGKWQFSGAWAGKLGLPNDLATATPAQQDAAARTLWNGGKGCSNWAACG